MSRSLEPIAFFERDENNSVVKIHLTRAYMDYLSNIGRSDDFAPVEIRKKTDSQLRNEYTTDRRWRPGNFWRLTLVPSQVRAIGEGLSELENYVSEAFRKGFKFTVSWYPTKEEAFG